MIVDKIRRRVRGWTQPILWKVYKWYLQKERWYTHNQIKVKVAPSVFHPGLLFSTKILLRFALKLDLQNKKVLELGAGSGLISLSVARVGGIVTATDINPAAVAAIRESTVHNQLELTVLHSDLFQQIPLQSFDYVLLNPPFFAQNPKTDRERAFFCGSNFEYFDELFSQIGKYAHSDTLIYMILTDDCAIETIAAIAQKGGWNWLQVYEEKVWGETNWIFELRQQ